MYCGASALLPLYVSTDAMPRWLQMSGKEDQRMNKNNQTKIEIQNFHAVFMQDSVLKLIAASAHRGLHFCLRLDSEHSS